MATSQLLRDFVCDQAARLYQEQLLGTDPSQILRVTPHHAVKLHEGAFAGNDSEFEYLVRNSTALTDARLKSGGAKIVRFSTQ